MGALALTLGVLLAQAGGVEVSLQSFPSGPRGGAQDLFAVVTPLLAVESGDVFALELGAPLRLRAYDAAPSQRTRDHFGLLRREDWDEASDFGQLLRHLRLGTEGGVFLLRAGAFESHTLGNGALLQRYANRLNPDHHPAGAQAVLRTGPLRTELFASDVLLGRVVAGELALDLARTFGAAPQLHDRTYLSLSALHESGLTGGRSGAFTLGWLEAETAIVRASSLRLSAHLGGGGRFARARSEGVGELLGAQLGVAGDVEVGSRKLPGRLGFRADARAGGERFRPGAVRWDHELARLEPGGEGMGTRPRGLSFRGEVALSLGEVFAGTLASEHFLEGRTDVETTLGARLFDGQGALSARFGVTGLGPRDDDWSTRWFIAGEARYRIVPSVYVLANGGTVFLPQAQGSGGLHRGVFAGLGAGFDFEG